MAGDNAGVIKLVKHTVNRRQTNFFALPKPMSSFDYRMYLTENAEKIMEAERQAVTKDSYCGPCVNPSTMLPEQTVEVCDGRKCSFAVNEPAGLGIGRKFFTNEKEGSYTPNDDALVWGAPLV